MRYGIFFILCIAHISASAQEQFSTIYFDKDWKEIPEKSNAAYYRTIEIKNDQFLVTDFYADTNTPQMKAYCNDIHPELSRDGDVVWFHRNGRKSKEATYSNDEPIGLVNLYYDNGQQRAEAFFEEEKIWYIQHWTSSGVSLLKNGTGYIIDENNDLPFSPHRIIKDSVVIGSFKIRIENQDTLYSTVQEKPTYKGGMDQFIKGISNTMTYPKEARKTGIQGRVYIKFIIDKKGIPQELSVLKGIGYGCDEEALSAVSKQKKWIPAKMNNLPVKTVMVMPIIFKLDYR